MTDTFAQFGNPSIYRHIAENINPKTGCLTEEGHELPDGKDLTAGGIRWGRGAMDGVLGHHGSGASRNVEKAETIANLAIEIAKHNKAVDKLNLYKILETGNLLQYIDPALKIIVRQRPPINPYLREYARFLARESSDRSPVKFGIALLGLIGTSDDLELIMTLGKHGEFTLFSSVAVCNREKEPDIFLYELAQYVDGWGRIQIIERLSKTQNPTVQDWMLREGYKNKILYAYTAFICAQAGNLLHALQANQIDQQLFSSSGEIIEALVGVGGPAKDINDYQDGAQVISHYVRHFPNQPKSVNNFMILHRIRDYLSSEKWDEEKRKENGWTGNLREQMTTQISALLKDSEWLEITRAMLSSEDEDEFYYANKAAEKLGIETKVIHWQRLKGLPSDSRRWFYVTREATCETIDQILALAEQAIPCELIATGPKNERGYGPSYSWHRCLENILWMLKRFPGRGKSFVLTGLKSPDICNRSTALRTLSQWDFKLRDFDIQSALKIAWEKEPYDKLQERMRKVIDGLEID